MDWTLYLTTAAALFVLITLRYFAIAGFFYWALWRRERPLLRARRLTDIRPPRRLILSEIRWSVIASAIYALPGALVLEAWKQGGTAIYADIDSHGWAWYFASIPVYLFLHDTYFYWTHRLMHHPRLFPVMHKVHHESRQPTPWAGFSFHPTESLLGAVILPLLAFLIPIHVSAILFILVLMTVVSVTNHSGFELLPDRLLKGPIGRHWISAAHHNLHHQRYSCNYALYFRFWDRLMGTDRLENEYPFLSTAAAAPVLEPGEPGG
ncbi:MAG: sterol desaturase family protein [Gammaproteobacteria bacterium]|nr:MAG: sterol desaturase family protein [Gammaproteobacteria bacterium]